MRTLFDAMNAPTLPQQSQRFALLMEFEHAWTQGREPSIESFLSRVEQPYRRELLRDLVAIDAKYRRALGHTPDSTDYVARFPELTTAEVADLIFTGTSALDRLPELPQRYQLVDEIARGGMGAVLRVIDRNLDRPLAIKIMLPRSAAVPELVARFVREAQLTGGLQHPGVPPVVEMDTLGDGMPFFSMKLVEGETLAHRFSKHHENPHHLEQGLAILEQVAQTLAFAHDRGVIHRDLKPANIMVGAFGEVQVMDWGMAKQITEDDLPSSATVPAGSSLEQVSAPADEHNNFNHDTIPATLGASEDIDTTVAKPSQPMMPTDDLTRMGDVMGTPSYMAPEQARGLADRINQRADVFALGAMLYELLTGESPYPGPSAVDRLKQAAAGDLSHAMSQLGNVSVDADLVDLARRCLAADPLQRPHDASAVAIGLKNYQESLGTRLEQERVQRAEAEIRTREERKRRKLFIAVGLLAMVLVAGVAAAAVWYQQDQAQQALAEQYQRDRIRNDSNNLITEAARLRRDHDWDSARTLLENATNQVGEVPEDQLVDVRAAIDEARIDLSAAERFYGIVFEGYELKYEEYTNELTMEEMNGRDGLFATSLGNYISARYGIDEHCLELSAEQIERVAESPIGASIQEFVHDWASATEEPDVEKDILHLAQQLDPHPDRKLIRQAVMEGNKQRVLEMAELAIDGEYDLTTVLLLAIVPNWNDHLEDQLRFLKAVVMRFPDNFHLRMLSSNQLQFRHDQPDYNQQFIESAAAAVTLQPNNASALFYYGFAQRAAGQPGDAGRVFRRVVDIDPKDIAAYRHLVGCYMEMGLPHLAERVAVELSEKNPDQPDGFEILGTIRFQQRAIEEATELLSRAVSLREERSPGGSIDDMPRQDEYLLAMCYAIQGQFDKAMNHHLHARAEFPSVEDHTGGLAVILFDAGRYRDAYALLTDMTEFESLSASDVAGIHYSRASAAALHASKNGEGPDAREWRTHAYEALSELLDLATETLEDGNESQQQAMHDLLTLISEDLDLASVRGDAIAALPEEERTRWIELWQRVAQLRDAIE